MSAPGLVCRIEADQHRNVDLRVLQAEVQLTSHKRSLKVQKWSISFISQGGKKKSDLSRVTYWESAGQADEDDALLSLTGLVTQKRWSGACFFCKNQNCTDLTEGHPDLLQHEPAQSAIILRSFLGGQKRSEETKTYKVGINVLLGSLLEPLQISAQLFGGLKAITSKHQPPSCDVKLVWFLFRHYVSAQKAVS